MKLWDSTLVHVGLALIFLLSVWSIWVDSSSLMIKKTAEPSVHLYKCEVSYLNTCLRLANKQLNSAVASHQADSAL